MPKSRSKQLLATTIVILAATCAAADAAGLTLQIGSSTTRQNLNAAQLQIVPPSAPHYCLPDTIARRVDLAYGNSTTRLSSDGQRALRELARADWESWVMLHQGRNFSNLAIATDTRTQMGFDPNRGMWWMTVSARPCRT